MVMHVQQVIVHVCEHTNYDLLHIVKEGGKSVQYRDRECLELLLPRSMFLLFFFFNL